MKTIRANGISIPYEITGTGPVLLLLHAGEGDHRLFDCVVTELAKSFCTLRFDQRDAGASQESECRYSMRDLADDAAALLNALEIDRTTVLGTSFGGMIAQELALSYPTKIDRLILAGTASHGRANDDAREKLAPYLSAAFANDDPRVRQAAELFYYTQGPSYAPALIDTLIAIRQRREEPRRSRRVHAVHSFEAADQLPTLRPPTLVLTGKADRLVAPLESWRLAQMIPRATLLMLGELGHHFYRQAPALTIQIARDFLIASTDPAR